MKLTSTLLKTSTLLFAGTALIGCGGGVTNWYISSKNVTATTPLEPMVHVIGDSFWDYGNSDNGAEPVPGRILKVIATHTGLIFVDHSITNESLANIIGKQVSELKQAQPFDQIKTILVDGGANDVKKICRGIQSSPDGTPNFTSDCALALKNTTTDRIALLKTLIESVPTLEKIVWASTISFPTTTIDPAVTAEFNKGIKDACRSESYSSVCLFVDVTTLWTESNADNFVLNDKQHVNDIGAQMVGDAIWSAMNSAGVYGANRF